jgi:hypothetical protein
MKEYSAAESAYKRALGIYEQAAQTNPQRYELELAKTLFNYGLLNLQKNETKICCE